MTDQVAAAFAPRQTPRRTAELAICIILPGLGPGGTERVVNFLANRWAASGWRVTVLTLDPLESSSYYAYRPDVAILRVGLPPEPRALLPAVVSTLRRVAAIRRGLRATAPDMVISFLSRTNVVALMASRRLGIPVVVSERNNPDMQPIGAVWHRLRTALYPRAFGLVTMTRGARDFFPARLRARSWVIPNFAEPRTGPIGRRGGKLLVAVGRLVPQKGFDLLIEAFARIAADAPEWRLQIWGDGPDRAALEDQRDRLGLSDRIDLPGVSRSHGSWVEGADAFVLSSRYEGWGIVLLEAMAAGLPVVSFDCQWGPREMINDGVDGLIVPREDVAGLGEALARLMGDPGLRQRLGDAALLSAQRYAPETVGAAWDEVVHEAVSRDGAD